MGMSVKFNGIELNKYISVLNGFTPFVGADWEPTMLGSDGIARGDDFSYTTYKSKSIPMPFEISGNLEENYNALCAALNVDEPKELKIGSVPDKMFYAIPEGDFDLEQISFLGEGTITWLIPDGLAHSTVEKAFPASLNEDGILEAVIVNEGTESVPISYEITHNHENGYIGIVSEHGVMQYGLVEEADGETYQQSEVLATSSHFMEWNSEANWKDDAGINGQNNGNKTAGTLEVLAVGGYHNLALKAPGTTANVWNGAMKTFEIVDSNGDSGAKDFYMYMNSWFETGKMGQTGAQTAAFLDENNKLICSQSIWKADMSGNTAHVDFAVGGNNPRIIKTVEFTPSYRDDQNPYNNGRGHSDMRKEGDKITFYWWGSYPSAIVPELKDVKVAKVQLYIAQYGARNMVTQYVTRNYFRRVTLQALHVEHWRDVPNRYQEGDVLTIDGNTRKAYVNGMIRLEDEVVGIKYFKAPPGETVVQFACSDFCTEPPDITARIREAYL